MKLDAAIRVARHDRPSTGLIRPYSGLLVELSRGMDGVMVAGSLWLVSIGLNLPWRDNYTAIA